MLEDWQHVFEFIAIESSLSPIFEHHDNAARHRSRGWIDFWSVAQNIVRVEIEGFAHGLWYRRHVPDRKQVQLRLRIFKDNLLPMCLALRSDDLVCVYISVLLSSPIATTASGSVSTS